METIITTLPIHKAKNRQCYERAKSVRQSTDRPISIVCPRHRLPAFQWEDGSDGEGAIYSMELIGGEYTGSETTLCTDWVSHFADTTFTHSGMNITSCVTATVFTATTNTFAVEMGDVIRIKGTMTGFTAPYPQIYMGPDSSTVYSLSNGVIDFEYTARVSSATASFTIFGLNAITFDFLAVSITRIDHRKELFWFMYPDAMPLLAHDYFTYHGQTLNYPLPVGDHYLKLTGNLGHVYYSDWFRVDCVYENLIGTWSNNGYETFTASGTGVNVVNSVGTTANIFSTLFTVGMGEIITVRFNMTYFGSVPQLLFRNYGSALVLTENCANGLNDFQFTTTWEGQTYITINTTALNDSFLISDVLVNRTYSEKFVIINFSNICDLGDILYHTGMVQTLWMITEPMELTFPQEEEGVKNGEGRFVRTFTRQTKKYLMRTPLLPDYMVEVFNRMKLHDTIQLTNLVGDVDTVYNLEVDHEWFDVDKYYAKIDLTFDHDETFVIAGCCNNLT
jgi:hypothetical protein